RPAPRFRLACRTPATPGGEDRTRPRGCGELPVRLRVPCSFFAVRERLSGSGPARRQLTRPDPHLACGAEQQFQLAALILRVSTRRRSIAMSSGRGGRKGTLL